MICYDGIAGVSLLICISFMGIYMVIICFFAAWILLRDVFYSRIELQGPIAHILFSRLGNVLRFNKKSVKVQFNGPFPLVANLSVIELSENIMTLINHYRNAAKYKGIQLDCYFEDGLRIYADPRQALFILRCVFDNAVKFSPLNATVTILCYRINGKVVTEVKDDGPKISKEDKKRIFGGMSHVHSGTAGVSGGGKSLMFCKAYLKINDGQIDILDRKGNGNIFKIAFNDAC